MFLESFRGVRVGGPTTSVSFNALPSQPFQNHGVLCQTVRFPRADSRGTACKFTLACMNIFRNPPTV